MPSNSNLRSTLSILARLCTDQQPDLTPPPNRSTGPKTPEGKSRCRLNAYRHGLTGQLCVFTPEEQKAYEKHSNVILCSTNN